MYVHVMFYALAYLFVCFGVIKQSDPMFTLNVQHKQYFSWRRLDTYICHHVTNFPIQPYVLNRMSLPFPFH